MGKQSSSSIRANVYLKNKMEGMSNYQAAVHAGYSPATAKNARKNVENRGVANTIYEALQEAGITNEHLAAGIKEGLSATKLITTHKGVQTVPDYAVRLRYIQLATMLATTPLVDRHNLTIQDVSYDDERMKERLPVPILAGLSIYAPGEDDSP